MFDHFLNVLKEKGQFSEQQAYLMQAEILQNKVDSKQILELFGLLENRNLSPQELQGILRASQEEMIKVPTKLATLDIVGTGGDKLDTFNISTVSSLVAASCGAIVAKHGNRAASGKCGSGDVLEKMGLNIDLNSKQAQQILEQTGFVFCFAKNFNPAFRFVATARKEYSKRTYFNFLGPLLNPTLPKYMIVGVSDYKMTDLMGETLIKFGCQKVWIVQSQEGMDEISLSSPTQITEFGLSGSNKFMINPQEYGLQICTLADIQINSADESPQIFENILNNTAKSAQINIVILNAACSLVVAGLCNDIDQGISIARKAVESLETRRFFEKVKKLSWELK